MEAILEIIVGIFVNMVRFGNRQQVYWEWELRGALAIAEGKRV